MALFFFRKQLNKTSKLNLAKKAKQIIRPPLVGSRSSDFSKNSSDSYFSGSLAFLGESELFCNSFDKIAFYVCFSNGL
jgi:hypothetical protein